MFKDLPTWIKIGISVMFMLATAFFAYASLERRVDLHSYEIERLEIQQEVLADEFKSICKENKELSR